MTRMISEKQPYPSHLESSLVLSFLIAVVIISVCTGNLTCVHGKLVIFEQKTMLYIRFEYSYTQYFSPSRKFIRRLIER